MLRGRWLNLAGEGRPERVRGGECTASLLRLLGVPPLAGRLFVEEEEVEGNHRVVILSQGLWQDRFGGAPDASAGRADGAVFPGIGFVPAAGTETVTSAETLGPGGEFFQACHLL